MRFAALSVLFVFVLALPGCAGADKETEAVEVAEQWVDEGIDDVSDVLVDLVRESPVVAVTFDKIPSLLADALSEQVKKQLVIHYTSSTRVSEDIYRVTGKAEVHIEVDLPIVGTRNFGAALPFTLDVNLAERTADLWTPLFELANVWETTELATP